MICPCIRREPAPQLLHAVGVQLISLRCFGCWRCQLIQAVYSSTYLGCIILSAQCCRLGPWPWCDRHAAIEALDILFILLNMAVLVLLAVLTLQQRIPQRRLVVPWKVVPNARQQQRAGAAGGQRPVSLR
jgi:hypothetical protein